MHEKVVYHNPRIKIKIFSIRSESVTLLVTNFVNLKGCYMLKQTYQ
jgi:hypothetical protein